MKYRSIFGYWGVLVLILCGAKAHSEGTSHPRDSQLLDSPWKFALGHATDRQQDFNHATRYFSYLAKAGYGDGPANPDFDDRGWRTVQLPHDWAVEMPIVPDGSHSHGYRAVGPGFPQNSVGWYRHHFDIPATDLGKHITLEFEGIQRAARVFVNGFFVGEENLGNVEQVYDLSPYLNYGGRNVVTVRADVSIEAGWYYEGAGINRHVWLHKTARLHVAHNGTFISSELDGSSKAILSITTNVVNDHQNTATHIRPADKFKIQHTLVDNQGNVIAKTKRTSHRLASGKSIQLQDALKVNKPALWSLDNPYLYTVVTELFDDRSNTLDRYETTIGIRSIRFDADTGFYLNGQAVKIKGTNNHEDHAGVGTATPYALIEYRLALLKAMGANTYRTSHAPASPDLLKAADKVGMLVVDETRLSGVNAYHLDALESMIKRDRNHPSIILWSLGNEEWGIEGNPKGARITQHMQSVARQLDPTRLNTVAISGGWGGSSTTIGVMGVNYIKHGDTDEQHKKYPWQILLGTEETTTNQTRGIYIEDPSQGHLPPQEDGPSGGNAESGWQYYASRDYLAGVIYWTGFDYRGEPTPYEFPAVSSQFGIMDMCGLPKDGYYYLKSWWTKAPVLHIFPHWNWPKRLGETIDVRVHSNAEAVELFLNDHSLGKKPMPKNGHLAWPVVYEPGVLKAVAWRDGQSAEATQVVTTGSAKALAAEANTLTLSANGQDVVVVNVNVRDGNGNLVPTANALVNFRIDGPGKIIGVGNGNPSSHEADVFVPKARTITLGQWQAPPASEAQALVTFEARFDLPSETATPRLLINAIGREQTLWLNGKLLYEAKGPEQAKTEYKLNRLALKAKNNHIKIEAKPFYSWSARENLAYIQPASFALLHPAPKVKRKTFNGWAQVIVQSTKASGQLILTMESDGLLPVSLPITVNK